VSKDPDWAGRVQRLEAEVAGLRRAMSSRAVIEQAKGVLAERLGCPPDEAFDHLSTLSQRSNVRLADLAASIVSSMVPTPAKSLAQVTGLTIAGGTLYQEAAAKAAAVRDLPGLAEAVRCGADRASFMQVDGDASVRELASAGSGPSGEGAAAEAITQGRGVFHPGGTQTRAAAFPIRLDDRVVGAVTFTWAGGGDFDDAERRFRAALGQLAQRIAIRVWSTHTDPIAAALEATFTPGLLLKPVRDPDGTVTDFVIADTSHQVPDMSGLSRVEQIGRRLLDTYPHLRDSGVFDAYAEVLRTGVSWDRPAQAETVFLDGAPTRILVSRRAIQHGDAVLASWRRHDEELRRDRQLDRMEQLGRFGWADWDLADRFTFWSDGLFQVFGRDPARGTESLVKLAGLAVPADRESVTAAVGQILANEHVTVEFHIRTEDGIRPIRLVADPVADDDGTVIRVLGIAQDLTESRRAADRMSRVQAQLADQRFQLAAQRELATALRQVLYPGSVCEVETKSARVVGRYAAPDADVPFRGDFCDSTLVADGHILFAIGDSFGSGARAGEVVARLLYPARALGSAGMSPATILTILNNDLHRDESPPLASLVVGRFCPVRGSISWSQGGHLPPVRLRADASAMLERPAGPALGLLPDAAFGEERFTVEQDDMIVWMTDGMVYERSKPNSDPWRDLRRKLVTARSAGGLDAILDLCEASSGDEACILTVTATAPAAPDAPCGFPGCCD
jgi:Stage II sporulation protein E (SpoIIE)/ANTAR domain/PAS fold